MLFQEFLDMRPEVSAVRLWGLYDTFCLRFNQYGDTHTLAEKKIPTTSWAVSKDGSVRLGELAAISSTDLMTGITGRIVLVKCEIWDDRIDYLGKYRRRK